MVLRVIGWIVVLVAILMFAGGLISLQFAARSFIELNLGRTPTPASVGDVVAGKYPVGSYLSITDGYVFPAILYHKETPEGMTPIATRWSGVHLMTQDNVSDWNVAKEDSLNKGYPEGVYFSFPERSIAELWPVFEDESQEVDARLIEPIQTSLYVKVTPVGIRTVSRLKDVSLGIVSLVLGICMMRSAIRIIREKRDILWWFDVRSDQT